MIALALVASALADPGALQVRLGSEVGVSKPEIQSLAFTFSLERQVLPRWHLGVGGRFLGQALYGTSVHWQPISEQSAWWASASWTAVAHQSGSFDLWLGLSAELGARRIQGGDWASLPTLADVILPPNWGYSQQALAQGGLRLQATRGHWGLQAHATGAASTLPEHLRGQVSPLTLWSGLALVFRI